MANITPDTKNEQDAAYSPEQLKKRELGDSPARTTNSSSQESVRVAEENPNPPKSKDSFTNNYTGTSQSGQQKKAKSFLKKNGPLIAIGGGGLGIAGLLIVILPAFLLFHILANMFGTFDPSSTALTQVTKVMLMNKLGANDATTGACNPVLSVVCRFKTPSSKLLAQLNDTGITALDAKGHPIKIDPNSPWPSERPSSYHVSSFLSESGKELTIKPSELSTALRENSALRLAFTKIEKGLGTRAYSRFSPAFLKVMDKWSFNLLDKLNIKERLTTKGKALISDILEKAIRSFVGESTVDSAKVLTQSISLQIAKALTKVDKLSKGSGIILAMTAQCMVNQVPSMLQKALVGVQSAAAVSMAAPVITSISAIKAGNGDADTASALGTMFNETDSKGKSMLDSAGMQYGLNGSKNTSLDSTYQTVTPSAFGNLGAALTLTDKIINNPVSSDACTLITNPVSGAVVAAGINTAINGSSLADFGLSTLLNWGIGEAFSLLLNSTTQLISSAVGGFLSSGVGNLAAPVINQMGQPGQTRGNVFSFGLGEITSAAGANNFGHYLTTDQLTAYAETTKKQQLADAEYDRATLSPLDPTSQYTFLGSIVGQLSPYYSSFSSIGGGLSMLGSLLPMSFGSILNPSIASAANSTSLYENACPDPSALQVNEPAGDLIHLTSDKTLAANIYCQPVPATLISNGWNPNDTVASIEGMQTDGVGEIDPATGQATKPGDPLSTTVKDTVSSVTSLLPGSTLSYADWLDTCSDPSNAGDCTGDDATAQTYSLYTAANNASIMLDDNQSAAQTASGVGTSAYVDTSTNTNLAAGLGSASQSALSVMSSLNNNSVATTNAAVSQTSGNLFSLVSSMYNLFKISNSSIFASTNSPAATIRDGLARYTLWG